MHPDLERDSRTGRRAGQWLRRPGRLLARMLALLALVLGGFGLAAQDSAPAQNPALVLTVDGAISPASADYIIRGIREGAERGAPLVILRMDTPGGLDTSMRDIIREILSSPVPVATYVTPSGARAASAGTYILYASHVAAMAPATNLGAATPIAIGGGGGGGEQDEESDPRGLPFSLGAEAQTDENGEADTNGGANGTANADDTEQPDSRDDAATEREEDTGSTAGNGVSPPLSASEAKAINDAVAYIRGLAELRDRNADWAERAVRQAESLSSREAAEMGVIDFVAENLDDLLRQADGMTVKVGEAETTLQTAGLDYEFLEPDWRTAILSVITNPNVALILMLVGIYGIIFEFLNPGVLVPGTVGAISLLLGLYSLALLPLNYAGVLLILLGLALIVAEAFAPSFGILGIGGTVALVVGAVMLVDTDVPGVAVSMPLIAAVAVMGLILTLIIARLATGAFRARVVTGQEELVGAQGRVLEWSGTTGFVWLHGERWKSEGPEGLAPGETVRVAQVSGLVLRVERAA
ncbi:NfeD family protein [Alkalilacustris brevis]|uniref:NfeD family protein n=1 Tax=Alkalilacustris brevis TaxID=2026338 RepID=UPI00192E5A88|nr:nodulation protein NfeD [Alkalilacustris brevis]